VATFLAPALFALFIQLTGDQAFGILGIVLVLAVGLVLLVPVRGARAERPAA
jgi:MFS transporter, UMF1 family